MKLNLNILLFYVFFFACSCKKVNIDSQVEGVNLPLIPSQTYIKKILTKAGSAGNISVTETTYNYDSTNKLINKKTHYYSGLPTGFYVEANGVENFVYDKNDFLIQEKDVYSAKSNYGNYYTIETIKTYQYKNSQLLEEIVKSTSTAKGIDIWGENYSKNYTYTYRGDKLISCIYKNSANQNTIEYLFNNNKLVSLKETSTNSSYKYELYSNGLIKKVWQKYLTVANAEWLITSYYYDNLGRKIQEETSNEKFIIVRKTYVYDDSFNPEVLLPSFKGQNIPTNFYGNDKYYNLLNLTEISLDATGKELGRTIINNVFTYDAQKMVDTRIVSDGTEMLFEYIQKK